MCPGITILRVEAALVTLSIARRADRFPDRAAIVDISEGRRYAPAETVHEDRVSYRELAAFVDRCVTRLAAVGLDAGDTLCFVSRNRVASLALLFACRRLEATFAPISHRLTPATVERPFDALDPDLVVFEAAQRDLVRSIPFDRSVALADLLEGAVESGGRSADASGDETPSDRVPLLALHGESGRPVAGFSARAVEWNCITAAVTWGLSADDSAIVCSPLSTPDGLFRIALPMLYLGGTVVLDRAFDPGDALAAIEACAVTTLACRTVAIRELAAEDGFAAVDGLERAICDESTPVELLEPYADRGVPVGRAYGRLECPTALAQSIDTRRSAEADPAGASSAPKEGVGRPVPDCRARLVDDQGTVLEGAAEGRLQLAGPVLAAGYVDGRDPSGGDRSDSRTGDREADSSSAERATLAGIDRSRVTGGWFDTNETVRRTEDGIFVPR